jgi:hypothetical protein
MKQLLKNRESIYIVSECITGEGAYAQYQYSLRWKEYEEVFEEAQEITADFILILFVDKIKEKRKNTLSKILYYFKDKKEINNLKLDVLYSIRKIKTEEFGFKDERRYSFLWRDAEQKNSILKSRIEYFEKTAGCEINNNAKLIRELLNYEEGRNLIFYIEGYIKYD